MKHVNDYTPSHPDTTGWKSRHIRAVADAYRLPLPRHGLESAVARAIGAWCDYAVAHASAYDHKIGEDYVLGPAWARWGFALRELLNGDLGRLDGGTLDTIIHDNLSEQGFNPDQGAP